MNSRSSRIGDADDQKTLPTKATEVNRDAEAIRAYWIRDNLRLDENLMPLFHLGVEVRCPWCARTHSHGVRMGNDREHRVAHCAGRYAEAHGVHGYYIVGVDRVEVPPDPRIEIAELRRRTGNPLAGMPRRLQQRARELMGQGAG